MIFKNNPCVAALLASFAFPAPRNIAITALIPTPNPTAIELIRFCTGYTRDNAFIASSLIFATKILSMMLYNEFTNIEITIGNAIDNNNGKIGFSFIYV